MKIPILIEPTSEQRYVATGSAPFDVSAEADTPDEALEKVKQLISDKVARGARIAAVELPDQANPWLAGAGMFRDDPLFDQWQQGIEDHRRTMNETADAP
jgi:hypothetical protein